MSYEIRIVGGGTVGRRITDRLEYRGDSVLIIEQDEARAQMLDIEGYRVIHGDGSDISDLDEASMEAADLVVVATGDDETNLLAAQLVRNRFSPESVIARINQPGNEEPFEELGIETVSRPDATAQLLDSHIESPAMTRWMESIGQRGDIQEITLQNPNLVGSTVGELDEELPEQVLLLMVGGEDDAHLPDAAEVLSQGDHLTVIGERSAVHDAMTTLTDEAHIDDVGASDRHRYQG